jgi:hypothetical protein
LLELSVGLPIGVTENFVVTPKFSYLMGIVSVSYDYGSHEETDSYINSVALPAIAADYYLNDHKTDNSFFFGAEVGFPSPSSGKKERYEFESDGLSFGARVGYAFGNGNFSIGYRSIPVKVKFFGGSIEESRNFGGVSLKFAYSFYFD